MKYGKKKDKKIKMSIGNAFKEFHFNIILNQDARISSNLRTALDIVLRNRLRIFFLYPFLPFHYILPCFYLTYIAGSH